MKKKALKIGVDVRCLGEGKRTGVEEYAIQMLTNLFESDQKNKYILFANSFREGGADLDQFLRYKNVVIRRFKIPSKLLNFLFWYFGFPKLDRALGGLDIFFMPNINFVALSKGVKLVLTVHDLSFEHMPEMFSVKRRLWHAFINPKRLCKRADAIVAVSDSTKEDVIEKYGVPAEKVFRIYSGVGDEYQKIDRNDSRLVEIKEKYKLPFKFIFFLGTIEPRKNIPALVRAFDRLKDLDLAGSYKLKLVISGSRGWKSRQTVEAMKNSRYSNDIIFISNVPNEDKNAIYNLSTIFVYPSFLEGFGFPVLEAMRCAVPVVASNVSSLPELVGAEGILIDPEKPDEVFMALKSLLENKDLNIYFRERGWRKSFVFSWKKTVAEFLNLLESI